MPHILGMSGSTILSNPDQFSELFQEGLSHIEIGEFPDDHAFQNFLQLKKKHGGSFGIHSPLLRGNSKYDLIEEVAMPPEKARKLFIEEAAELARAGADYMLVHFPYFNNTAIEPGKQIEEGLEFLHNVQETYGIPVVCEPKLGTQRSAKGIQYLHEFPSSLWEKYGLSVCIDIGDYQMAVGEEWRTYIEPLLPFTKVVHLHNVRLRENGYIWVPIHPKLEHTEGAFEMQRCLELLGSGSDKYFIFEHTPHTEPSKKEVSESIQWVRDLLS
ncbi:TIM barrel protein [Halobacillus litoralis]|uniref:Xylose isomerase-like TIM barrel domain-containing protein n=1 Tax=Halobacillus litoralis TaxID=45668 RepID=A0A410MH76_9BACI|nr:TIM barrel protein [Halobacillus litoralis]QAS54099.1 hypothetical protein HLI_18725 [Halobacillus litoralis]